MKKHTPAAMLMLIAAQMITGACGYNTNGKAGQNDSDSVAIDSAAKQEIITALPDTQYESVKKIDYRIDVQDTTDATLEYFDDLYAKSENVMTFRKNLLRNADFGGSVKGTPSEIEINWQFKTHYDGGTTAFGSWGGGTGWTGQPLFIHWTKQQMEQQRQQSKGLTDDFSDKEIIVGSLCGKAYFINYETGKESRLPLDLGNVVKGTPSKDPELMNLYVGQGVPSHHPIGCEAFDLLRHERTFFYGPDPQAWRGWGAFDSSPVVVGGFLFWPGENGSFYKYRREQGMLHRVSVLRYRINGAAPGIESSLCVYRNYGYFGDNHGNILCVNLNTMKPVWTYQNHDDTDGTIVCREEGGTPYIYTACEVDKQGLHGTCHFVKLNALDGSLVWEQPIACNRVQLPSKTLDGGMYSTPLLGSGDCDSLIFANICRNEADHRPGQLTAINTRTGAVSYTVPYGNFCWSSPVKFLNEKGEMFIFTADANGTAYLIRGRNGEILCKKEIGSNFESSPAVIGNTAVVGTRGNTIYKFTMK